jgi:WXG100 family type VII secretion target
MANVTVTYDDLRTQATQLRSGQASMEEQLSRLKGQIENLVASGYVTDSSSKAFSGTYTDFSAGASKTIAALDDMARFLENAAETLQAADEQLAASLR